MLKIYFACSIRGGRDDAALYAQLIDMINQRAVVLTEIFGDPTLTAAGMTTKTNSDIHDTDIAWVKEADAIIAEVTNPSLGVGYELGQAEALGKPILALFREDGGKQLSAMIEGAEAITTRYYTNVADATNHVDAFLAKVSPV